MAARALSTAAVSFGLVSIPVKLFTPNRSESTIRFNQLDSNGARLKQQYISTKTGEVVPKEEIQKGYEFAKGQFVTFSKEELKALEAKATGTIDIKEFVPLDEVDPLFYDKPYYLGPDKGGAKPYQLLAQAMRETGYVAVAKYPSRGKDHLVVIRPYEHGLVMEQLRYTDEIRPLADVPIDKADVEPAEIELAKQLIGQVSSASFEPEKYHDEVKQQVLDLIERKIAGEEITIEAEEVGAGKIIDLMEALKASVQTGKKAAQRVTKKKSAAKKKSAG